jgi:hypothetical protein
LKPKHGPNWIHKVVLQKAEVDALYLPRTMRQVRKSISTVAGTLRNNTMRFGNLIWPSKNGQTAISLMVLLDGITAHYSLKPFQLVNSSFSEVNVLSTTKVLPEHLVSMSTQAATSI